MELQVVLDEGTEDYAVRSGKRHLGTLYAKDCEILGQCWVFDVKVKDTFGRNVYFYSSPESAACGYRKKSATKKKSVPCTTQPFGLLLRASPYYPAYAERAYRHLPKAR